MLHWVLWHCWFGNRKSIPPITKLEWWGAIFLEQIFCNDVFTITLTPSNLCSYRSWLALYLISHSCSILTDTEILHFISQGFIITLQVHFTDVIVTYAVWQGKFQVDKMLCCLVLCDFIIVTLRFYTIVVYAVALGPSVCVCVTNRCPAKTVSGLSWFLAWGLPSTHTILCFKTKLLRFQHT